MSTTSSSCSSTTTYGGLVTDSNGNLWDLASPDIIGIQSQSGGTQTLLIFSTSASPQGILVSFSVASAAFTAARS